MKPRTIERLTAGVSAVCPIHGVSLATNVWNPTDVKIVYKDEATGPQKAAAIAVVAAFDPSDTAQDAWELDQQPEKRDIRAAAEDAIADINTFLALANPNNAQVLAIVRKLCQQNKAIIKRLVQLD